MFYPSYLAALSDEELYMREWESSHHPQSENCFSVPSRNKFFAPELPGDAGDDGEGGANRESATALLVMAVGGASGDGGGGGSPDMAVIFAFFLWQGKIWKRAKS